MSDKGGKVCICRMYVYGWWCPDYFLVFTRTPGLSSKSISAAKNTHIEERPESK